MSANATPEDWEWDNQQRLKNEGYILNDDGKITGHIEKTREMSATVMPEENEREALCGVQSYFISYETRGFGVSFISAGIIDEHPLVWWGRKQEESFRSGGGGSSFELIFWKEISIEEKIAYNKARWNIP